MYLVSRAIPYDGGGGSCLPLAAIHGGFAPGGVLAGARHPWLASLAPLGARTRSTPPVRKKEPALRLVPFHGGGGSCPSARELPVRSLRAGFALGVHPWTPTLRFLNVSEAPGRANPFNSPQEKAARLAASCFFLEVGGVEPPSPGAGRWRLRVYPSYRVVGAGVAKRRAFRTVSRLLSPCRSGPASG